MKLSPICWLLILCLLCACHKEKAQAPEIHSISENINHLQQIPLTRTNGDSLKAQWEHLLKHNTVKESSVFKAKVNYQLAKLYAITGQNDSSSLYLEKAFEQIESEEGNWDEKARIYQGIGNISTAEGYLHRANYYYNKAASIVLADSVVQLEPTAKSAILLAAAQSNQQFHRYELALEMNRSALRLSQQLPENHVNRQRPITQLIQTMYYNQSNVDSIGYYVGLLEELHRQSPASYDAFYLYESKALYYDMQAKPDSAFKYQLLKVELQENTLQTGKSTATARNNLFITYVNIAGFYTEKNNVQQASAYFRKANGLLLEDKTIFDYGDLIVYYQNLEKYNRLSGHLKQSLEAANEVIRLQKELYNKQNTQAVAEMSSLYEIQTQERSINQLKESLQVKELQLQQNKLWMIVSILAAAILFMVLFFIYYGFRQRRLRQEKDKLILQQQLLRTQMEPHFIFNTLTALQNYIRRGESKEAIGYLSRFSKLLRNSLEISREQLVSLAQEIETLEHYLTLQQMRFQDAFSYIIHLPEEMEADEIRIPPMLIQPFVENSILHGVDMKTENGFVHVHFSEEGNLLRVEIVDSGRVQKAKSPSDSHRSLSGIISRERLSLLGHNARIETKKNVDGGTSVVVYIPIG